VPAPAPVTPPALQVNVADAQIQYTKASFKLSSDVPVKASIEYGTDSSLGINTTQSDFTKTPELALDDKLLVPGTQYYYRIEAVSQTGEKYEGPVEALKTKGITVNVALLNKSQKPVKNYKVALHSETLVATSDDKGVVVFKDVPPGKHELTYTAGKRELTKTVEVAGNISTDGDGNQTAQDQNISVTLDEVSQSSPTLLIILLAVGAAILIAVVLGVIAKMRGGGQGGMPPFQGDIRGGADPVVYVGGGQK
jgi:hypothetical protein